MNIWDSIINKLTYNVGIDLGTSSTLVSIEGIGLVAKEPSVVAINKKTSEILAVGDEAKKMVGRTPGDIVAIRPLRNGVITDFEMTEAMLKYFVQKAHLIASSKEKSFLKNFRIPRPRVVVGVPSGITEVERRAVIEATTRAGAREVYIIEETMAASIGAGLPIENPSGSMIIDIGGGTSDIAIISLGQIVIDKTIRLAGDQIDLEIISYIKHNFGLQIGDRTAEDIKIALGDMMIFDTLKKVSRFKNLEKEKIEKIKKEKKGKKTLFDNSNNLETDSEYLKTKEKLSKYENYEEPFSFIRGREIRTGLPKEIKIYASDLFYPISKVIDSVVDSAREAIELAPPEILGDLLTSGITLAGGGALIRNIDKYFQKKLATPVIIAEDPVSCVVKGCTIVLNSLDLLKRISTNDD